MFFDEHLFFIPITFLERKSVQLSVREKNDPVCKQHRALGTLYSLLGYIKLRWMANYDDNKQVTFRVEIRIRVSSLHKVLSCTSFLSICQENWKRVQ